MRIKIEKLKYKTLYVGSGYEIVYRVLPDGRREKVRIYSDRLDENQLRDLIQREVIEKEKDKVKRKSHKELLAKMQGTIIDSEGGG